MTGTDPSTDDTSNDDWPWPIIGDFDAHLDAENRKRFGNVQWNDQEPDHKPNDARNEVISNGDFGVRPHDGQHQGASDNRTGCWLFTITIVTSAVGTRVASGGRSCTSSRMRPTGAFGSEDDGRSSFSNSRSNGLTTGLSFNTATLV
jgi:hypothetical protein